MDELGIALSEISHSEKEKYCMLSLMYNLKNKLVNITTTTTKADSQTWTANQWLPVENRSGTGQSRGEGVKDTN